MEPYALFEDLSLAAGVGVVALSAIGGTLFESSRYKDAADFLKTLCKALDCGDSECVALLYGSYQARRFGGRYIFLAPSGLAYCACPLTEEKGEMASSAVAGPFLMTDREEYMDLDILERHQISGSAALSLRKELEAVPYVAPARVRAICEMLFICVSYFDALHFNASHFNAAKGPLDEPQFDASHFNAAKGPLNEPQFDASHFNAFAAAAYPLEKEDELLAAISIGDVAAAGALLNDILGQVLFHSYGDLEILRSRVVELTVLLSRAAIKGSADAGAIFGLNYSFLREINALGTRDDIIVWLHGVTRRFAQHVFDHAYSGYGDAVGMAVLYIKQNYAKKITLQDVAEHVYLSASYFSKVFREKTGKTPGQYLTDIRVDAGKKLLRDPGVNIAEIPEVVGFESQSYFTRVFKKAVGRTPWRYRRQQQQKPEAD